jgi:hypothetical protein
VPDEAASTIGADEVLGADAVFPGPRHHLNGHTCLILCKPDEFIAKVNRLSEFGQALPEHGLRDELRNHQQ